jgi:hypothetical protein
MAETRFILYFRSYICSLLLFLKDLRFSVSGLSGNLEEVFTAVAIYRVFFEYFIFKFGSYVAFSLD